MVINNYEEANGSRFHQTVGGIKKFFKPDNYEEVNGSSFHQTVGGIKKFFKPEVSIRIIYPGYENKHYSIDYTKKESMQKGANHAIDAVFNN